jgi:hypothetical protein
MASTACQAIILSSMQNPWDQQPNESSKAFERFALYRDMGGGRSLRKLAKDLELKASTLAEISKKHNWQERIIAFDAYIDKASQHNQIAQVRAMKRRQITLALRAQKLAEKGLKRFLRDFDDEQVLRKLSPEGLSKILDTGCRLERLNRDEPEQNLEVVKSQNFDRLSLEECETLKNLHAKAEGKA